MTPAEDEFARTWFDYGGWDAPYWFVGMEPGGNEAADNLTLWERAGRPDLSDLNVSLPGQRDWFGPAAKTQRTWAKLIWLLLSYQGREPTAAATVDYQRHALGRLTGETALLELSPFAAVSTGHDAPREYGRAGRIATLAARIRDHRPEFVVFYSTTYADEWAKFVGTTLTEGRPLLVGRTACVMTYHPTSIPGDAKAYWKEIAARLRAARAAIV